MSEFADIGANSMFFSPGFAERIPLASKEVDRR